VVKLLDEIRGREYLIRWTSNYSIRKRRFSWMDVKGQMFKDSCPSAAYDRHLRHEAESQRALDLQEALETFEVQKTEVIPARTIGLLHSVDDKLSYQSGRFISTGAYKGVNVIRQFKPYDRQTSDAYPGVEFETTAVAFDIYDKQDSLLDKNRESHRSGYMVLFRLGFAGEKFDGDTIGIGENARYGALVEDGCLRPLRLDTTKIKRHTEYSPSCLVSVVMLDDNDPGYSEVLDEVDRFLDQCGPKESE